jgi:hypothetical protein
LVENGARSWRRGRILARFGWESLPRSRYLLVEKAASGIQSGIDHHPQSTSRPTSRLAWFTESCVVVRAGFAESWIGVVDFGVSPTRIHDSADAEDAGATHW